MGLQIRELTPVGLESASVAEIEVPPGSRHETARSTRSDKVYICIQGKVTFRVENSGVELETGDVLLIKKNEWFDYVNDTESPVKMVLLHIPPFDINSEEFKSKEII